MTEQAKGEITRILVELRGTDRKAALSRLLPLVYAELRAVAGAHLRHERPDHTLQATALVHEAYVRMLGGHDPPWNDRGHFFRAAAEAMRRILIEHARKRGRIKRGGKPYNRMIHHQQKYSESPQGNWTENLLMQQALRPHRSLQIPFC